MDNMEDKLQQVGRWAMNIEYIGAEFKSVDSDGKPIDGTNHEVVFLYNRENISREEVIRLLSNDSYTNDTRLIMTDPERFEHLFPHRGESRRNNLYAYWKPRTYANDSVYCECSKCRFKIPAVEAVKIRDCLPDYTDVRYHFCPNCGSAMSHKPDTK